MGWTADSTSVTADSTIATADGGFRRRKVSSDTQTSGDRSYLASQGNNGLFATAAPAGSYPFVPGNDNVPGALAQTPALVRMSYGARPRGDAVCFGASVTYPATLAISSSTIR